MHVRLVYDHASSSESIIRRIALKIEIVSMLSVRALSHHVSMATLPATYPNNIDIKMYGS